MAELPRFTVKFEDAPMTNALECVPVRIFYLNPPDYKSVHVREFYAPKFAEPGKFDHAIQTWIQELGIKNYPWIRYHKSRGKWRRMGSFNGPQVDAALKNATPIE